MTTPLHVTCYQDLTAWWKKKRKYILASAGLIGAGVLSYYGVKAALTYHEKYHYRKIEEAKAALRNQFLQDHASLQISSHFESIQKISDFTTLPSVLPRFKSRLHSLIDLPDLTEKIKQATNSDQTAHSRSKLQLWNDLKLASFSRTVCAVLGLCLLHLFVRVQLNILGRIVYIDTAMDAAGESFSQRKMLTLSCQHKFIAFADYLPHWGLESMIDDVYDAVCNVFKDKALNETFTASQVASALRSVFSDLDKRQIQWSSYVLPKDNALPTPLAIASSQAGFGRAEFLELSTHGQDAAMLDELLDESRMVLDSYEFNEVLNAALDAVLDTLMDAVGGGSSDPSKSLPLAKIIPQVASVGSDLLDCTSDVNAYIQLVGQLPQIHRLCAIVYTGSNA